MSDWVTLIIYCLGILLIVKANRQISEVNTSEVFQRPQNWPWYTWQVHLIQNAIKPKKIDMPLGMWIIILYLSFGVVGMLVMQTLCSMGIFGIQNQPKLFSSVSGLFAFILPLASIYCIHKKIKIGWYLIIILEIWAIWSTLDFQTKLSPDLIQTLPEIIENLLIPIIVIGYTFKNRKYFQGNAS